ncbi:TIGR03943 family protein [Microbacterium sp. KRD172]|uniref:TIGR03943 family putative permease subunit n=1 Tax=Microbacterium sp. KRD172 TaxID=2729727 RepID=UPI001F49FAE5|nr:TIGR03943 family protein [Microbacterium sp. KRD172]
MAEQTRTRWRAIATRWLGLGLAVVISVVTLGLGLTGRLTLYISPESIWFACVGAVVVLAGAIWSCTLPLGAETDHGHDHGHALADAVAPRRALKLAGVVSAGVVASGVVIAALVLPPASLSVELATSRADATGPVFAAADAPTLGVADTTAFGVGEWSSVFATATRPEAYDGSTVTLTGFVTRGPDADAVNLTRMVITHCVIDAQPAAVPVSVDAGESGKGQFSTGQFSTGQWIEVTGTVTADSDGSLRVVPASVVEIDEPEDPYEY